MQPDELINEINRVFREEDASLVIAALRQDDIVWNTLQDMALIQSISANPINSFNQWRPAAIFCLQESLPTPEDLQNLSLGIDGTARQSAIQQYEKVARSGFIPENLKQAGYAALALRERRKFVKSWDNLSDEIQMDESRTESNALKQWRTIISILSRIIPDNEMLFNELINLRGKIGRDLVTHAILSNPNDPKNNINILAELMIGMDLAAQIDWLQSFALRGERNLSEQLSKLLIANTTSGLLGGFLSMELSNLDMPQVAAKAARLQQAATLYQLAGREIEANRFLNSAAETLTYLSAGIRLQQAGIQTVTQSPIEGISSDLFDNEPGANSGMQGELIVAAASGGNKSIKGLPPKMSRAFYDLREAAKLAVSGEIESAREIAEPSIQLFLRFIETAKEGYSPKFLVNWQPQEFVELLVDLDYLKEAALAAEWFLNYQPTNARLLGLLGDLFNRDSQPERAAKSLALAVSLKPKETENRRLLAKLYETNNQYESAYQEWTRIIELSDNPQDNDKLYFAKTALLAGNSEEAFKTAQALTESDPFNGIAASLAGRAAAAEGNNDLAAEYLNKSVLLAPDYVDAWLTLSKYQKQNGDVQQAYETLRSASSSLPDSPEINLELALLSMETGRPSEALPHLRLAASLQPENLEVAQMLTNALLTLGHKDEVVEFLGEARKRWPEEITLARTHGLLLQENGNYPEAVKALKTVVRENADDEESVTNLCLSLVESNLESLVINGKSKPNANLAETAQIVSSLLFKKPDTVRGHLILGALQIAMGNLNEAMTEFKSAVEISADVDNELHWIAQAGLGRTALSLNRPEIAMAVLDEAASAHSDNVAIQKLLVPAYMKANLPQEALITAQHAMEMAPDDIETLVWYSTTMLEFGDRDAATKTIRKASDAVNIDAKSLINLANLAIELNELPSARKALLDLNILPEINANYLEKAARIQTKLGDFSSASENLRKALENESSPNPAWLFEMGCLQKALGNYSSALESTRQAISINPLSIENWLLQGALFEEQGRHQSALESLEKTVSLTNKSSNENEIQVEEIPLFQQYRGLTTAEIHSRFSRLMVKVGNLTGALVHAEQSLEFEPKNLNFRLLAARLAESMLLSDRAILISEITADEMQNILSDETDQNIKDTAAEILSIKALTKLSNNNLTGAEMLLQEIRRLSPNSFAVENMDIRLKAAQGLLEGLPEQVDNHVVQHLLDNRKSKPAFVMSGMAIAAIDAALVSDRWELALKLAEQALENHPNEPAAFLAIARVLVRSAEESTIRQELKVEKHKPQFETGNKEFVEKFDTAIQSAAKLSNSIDVSRWQKRGLMIFGGKAALDNINPSDFTLPEDFAMYFQALRKAQKFQEVINYGEKIEETPQVLLQMALAYVEINPRVGLDLCQHAMELLPPSPLTYAIAAKLAEKCGENGLAIDYLHDALQNYPDEPLWRIWVANLLANQKDFEPATYHLEEAVALQPESATNWEQLGKMYLQNKETRKAVSALSKALEINPENPELLLSLASAHRTSGEIQEALDCIEKSIEMKVLPDKALLLRGEISRDLGNLIDAIDFSKKALRENANNLPAYIFLAQTLRVAGKPSEAIATIDSALKVLGSNLDLLLEKARIMHSFYGSKDTLPFLQSLAEDFPNNDEILSMLAKVQAEIGDLQSAEETALESLKIQPRQPDLNTFVGKILRKSGQLDKAVHHFSQAVQQSKMELEPVIELAQTHLDQRSYEKALEAFKLAIQIAPRDIRAYVGAASIYRDSKDFAQSEEMLKRAVEIEPTNLAIRRQLGAVVALNLVHSSQEAKTLA